MTDNVEKFRALHVPGKPLVLYNIWDAGSAKAVVAAGAPAIATGSYGVAEAHGLADGESMPLDLVLANLSRIAATVGVPVSVDLESGYGATLDEVTQSVIQARDAGASGINMEDRLPNADEPLPVEEASRRFAAAANAGIFINARCDVFRGKTVDAALLADAKHRATAYADAGAAGLFVPFLSDAATIGAICEASPIPVNILWSDECESIAALADLGVARISFGHQPWAKAMADLGEAAAKLYKT
ncbi:isocitrate lyase/phosphoenolpyruvate mutase family protein [Pontixanthobacter sp. CEM42]|uniref:isocitrate lyase/PEP mutase family protein n=1 Tax=Pontixanthobacter sp. CEM42 TaxID=2792077 RepID=UPI001ADEE2E1|nr:isocitrate lyase/phosphoenolpyruvate mutase family protein [Pontixanthobacter sp. CEM42]